MTSSRVGIFSLALALIAGLAVGQAPPRGPNEEYVKPGANVQDARTPKLWVLDFKFKSPRLITVNIPGKGNRLVWYLWYQVINYSGEPRTFIPEFELFTHDKGMSYPDQVLPTAIAKIRQIEDRAGADDIKNTVTISSKPIPVSLPKADPRPVTGVATWIDPNEIDADDDADTKAKKKERPRLAESNRYSIFISGLSNGFTLTDDPGDKKKQLVRRKTLQLLFQRLGDKSSVKSEAIRFRPPAVWIYRASKATLDTAPADK
jgi:hypothetical protein